ncbi:MAG: hypothetical protein BECKG1743D_GA0114223_100994 [Candidatus Kentron sp. G]|nr:MAG: hypothetical protein BECKG1743D_GA0114223_100994 [Candidatus Kentron sp. G]
MTNLYAWNTARAGSVAISECTRGAPIPPYKGRQFFGLCSIHLSPNKKIRPSRPELGINHTLVHIPPSFLPFPVPGFQHLDHPLANGPFHGLGFQAQPLAGPVPEMQAPPDPHFLLA